MKPRLPKLPQLLDRKIYKTGQTRGADDDVIYQNRVGRNSTVLIPYPFWGSQTLFPEDGFDNGYIVLITPQIYFESDVLPEALDLELGHNCIVFYETRSDWERYNPEKLGWTPAQSRKAPLGGHYVARVPATTATEGGEKIRRGFTSSKNKGAGIRLYEYASTTNLAKCRLQLEAIYWLCLDSVETVSDNGMNKEGAIYRKDTILNNCHQLKLLDFDQLIQARIINKQNRTVCPLCLEELSGNGFLRRLIQAEGRDVPDLTVTEINLFHIKELRYGSYNHRPYNLGWGHHHCNVVTKDDGVEKTLNWMQQVLERNHQSGFVSQNSLP
jgi:hypothetical protein